MVPPAPYKVFTADRLRSVWAGKEEMKIFETVGGIADFIYTYVGDEQKRRHEWNFLIVGGESMCFAIR